MLRAVDLRIPSVRRRGQLNVKRYKIESDDFVESTSFSSCGNHLVATTTCGSIRIWNTKSYFLTKVIHLDLESMNSDSVYSLKRAFFKAENPNILLTIAEDDCYQKTCVFDVTHSGNQLSAIKVSKDTNFSYINSLPNDLFYLENQSREIGHVDLRSANINIMGKHHNTKYCRLYTSEQDPNLFTMVDKRKKVVNIYDRRYMFSACLLPTKSFEIPLSKLLYTCFDHRGSKIAVLGGDNDVWVYDTNSYRTEERQHCKLKVGQYEIQNKIRPLHFMDSNSLLLSYQDLFTSPNYENCDVSKIFSYNLSTNKIITLQLSEATKVTSAIDYRICSKNDSFVVGLQNDIDIWN